MALFKITITQYWLQDCWLDAEGNPCPEGTPGSRFVQRRRVKPGTPGASKVKRKSTKWYGRLPGGAKPIPLSANKVAAQQMLAALVNKAELGKVGIADPFEAHRKRPLLEHVADFKAYLTDKGNSGKHARDAATRVKRVVKGCRFAVIDDITLSRVQEFLGDLTDTRLISTLDPAKTDYTKKELASLLGVKPHSVTPLVKRWRLEAKGNGKRRRFPKATAQALCERMARGAGPATVNHYVRSMRAFTRWLVRDRRTGHELLAGLSSLNPSTDVRRGRRPLSHEELVRVLEATLVSPRDFRGLSGRDRHFLYLAACASGLRAGELSMLTSESFCLEASPPTVTVPSAYTKNKKLAVQPLPAEIAERLRGYLAERPAALPVWPGGWADDAAQMFQADIEAVGIPYFVDGPDGPLFADFHALRHSYVALLDHAGVSPKTAMQLARHSDPKLTMAIYGRAQLHDLGAAVAALPTLADARQALKGTGTNGTGLPPVCTGFAHPIDRACRNMRGDDRALLSETGEETGYKSLTVQGVEATCDSMRADDASAPCRTRTYNPLIKSQLLCQLS